MESILGEGAWDLYTRARSAVQPDINKGSMRLMGACTADEVWAAAALIESCHAAIVIDTVEFMPLWRFALRRLGVHATVVDEDHVPESDDFDAAISSVKTSLGNGRQIYTSRNQVFADIIVFSMHNGISRVSHDVDPAPTVGRLVEEEAVNHVRSLNCVSTLRDVDRIVARLFEAREREGTWRLRFRSKAKVARFVAKEAECPICLMPMDRLMSMVEQCKHTFCSECLTEWLTEHTTCPLCRASTLMGVVHNKPVRLSCEMDPNPFFLTVSTVIDSLIQRNPQVVAVASKFKYHPRAVCKRYPHDFTLHPPGTVMQGVWVAVSRIRRDVTHCYVTESVSERDSEILAGALRHTTRRPVHMHAINVFPLSRARIKAFFMGD